MPIAIKLGMSIGGGSTSPPAPPPPSGPENLYLRTITEKGDTVPENLYLRTIEEKE